MSVQPFEISIPDEVLEDMHQRIGNTRWPDEIPDTDWDYGSNMAYIKELTEYWRTQFDWRAQEKLLNSFSNFRADVDGMGIHFIHPSPDHLHVAETSRDCIAFLAQRCFVDALASELLQATKPE